MIQDKCFFNIADGLKPKLFSRTVIRSAEAMLRQGDTCMVDFEEHLVGYVTLGLETIGSHPDAPLWLEIQFAERERELSERVEDYKGWISSSWIQQERIHADRFPCTVRLDRRYAFRYVKVTVRGISKKYALSRITVTCEAVSSADGDRLLPYESEDKELRLLDHIACRTLRDCMQDVFEDGPKRDRRLWLGDLRLQALANGQTYRQFDLVKRCLYLFAGSTLEDGQISAAVFTDPEPEADDTVLFDYSLLFVPTLLEYYEMTGDRETLSNLWPTALRQIELARASFDDSGIVRDSDRLGWCFIDWNLDLNKQAAAQGTYLYCEKAARRIASILGEHETACRLEADYSDKKAAAMYLLFDRDRGVFISSADRQVSLASQIWMILGGVSDDPTILDLASSMPDTVGIVTPYLYHYYVQALLDTGRKEQALSVLRAYWGSMAKEGADTFWELYNPENPNESPYGGTIVLSYCHAWSCAPAYFLRKYFAK